ncbi:hypothetical protein [Natronobacterium gregoryi]|uniref:DUF4239 domain-containing protein n=2 Tax=Natronobacterium gregoryi TaxID=44930 RepID=L0AKZ0_NATGS|nr:hypothetical protein [Natronobacterium gregoryi]AFZ73852.1 hypothetical protein Natgr_2703 [Natronobacterium gregoryi SP2]ELY65098.1 hypothetical protein C490_14050 [Natronobacterium gregoryi SP2]PLK19693.1 hypothetical protein CYV19_13340 [Natronobacterium gregoryi SP2]SFJ42538.1 hypothetical protein SAMN05443661_12841 [Natronobacterium gregoryi]
MSDSDSSESNENERLGGLRLWVLLRVDRWVLTGIILAVVFAILVTTSRIGLTPLRLIVENQDGLEFFFSAFIGAIITGTSIVVTINQLVLSQELGAVGQQRDRMQAAMDFRQTVEATIDADASPPEPAAFLYELVEGIQKRATELEAEMEDERDEKLKGKIGAYVEDTTDNAESVKANLENAQFGTFEVIWNALQFNYSRKIYDARKIRADHTESLSEEANEKIDHVIETLRLFGPAREHFKTLYFQWELINLSRALLYISVPALTAMAVLIMYVDGNALPGTTLGIDNLVWLASLGFVIGISPFVVFIVYILRIATIAKRTLAMGPFILRESERDEDLG